MTWENKKNSIIALTLIHLFFYFYICRGNSLINLVSRGIILYLVYAIVRPKGSKSDSDNNKEQEIEIISEEGLKQLYVIVYVGLNKAVQYVRSII